MSKIFTQFNRILAGAAAILTAAAVSVTAVSCSKDDPAPEITMDSINTFVVDNIPQATYEGATFTVGVKSYTTIRTFSDGELSGEPRVEEVKWSVEYSTDDGVSYSSTAPDWVKVTRNVGDGNATVVVKPQTSEEVTTGPAWTAEQGTNDAPYNLASSTGAAAVENTANCYIVNGPGYYKLPLVYGNAIKEGATNAEAYTSADNTFVNHLNQPIVDPYIYNNGATPSEAAIVWQDAEKDVITDAALCDNNTFLKFRIAPEAVNYDNAVVAVKDAGGAILWSWHIWVTTHKLGEGDKQGDFAFMPQNLGYLPEATTSKAMTYPERSCMVKFIMDNLGAPKTAVKTITQTVYSETPTILSKSEERALYYQWGRKDPLRANGPTIACPANYGDAINNPGEFYTTTTENWPLFSFIYDCWHSGLTLYFDMGKADAKTVYDPSPVGYCVPNSNAFKGFTLSNAGSFFTADGYLDYSNGQVSDKGSEGRYLGAAVSGSIAYQMVFNGAAIRNWTCDYIGYGCSVRAVKENKGTPDTGDVDVDGYDPDDRNPDLK